MKLSLASKRYLVTLKMRGYSEDTIHCRRVFFRQIRRLLDDPEIEEISLEKLHRIFAKMSLKSRTVGDYLNRVQMLLRHFKIPAEYALPKAQESERPYLTKDEVLQIINSIPKKTIVDYRDRALIFFLFDTGLRISEVLRLTRDKIDLENGTGRVLQKGGSIRSFFLTKEGIGYLQDFLTMHNDEKLFIGFRWGGMFKRFFPVGFTRQAAWMVLKRRTEASGIKKKVGPHALRHSFTFDLLMNGCDVLTLQRLLGHHSVESTLKYVHLCDTTLFENFQLFKSKQTTYELKKKRGMMPGFKIKLQIMK
jgi:site-specific recombinase XerD